MRRTREMSWKSKHSDGRRENGKLVVEIGKYITSFANQERGKTEKEIKKSTKR